MGGKWERGGDKKSPILLKAVYGCSLNGFLKKLKELKAQLWDPKLKSLGTNALAK